MSRAVVPSFAYLVLCVLALVCAACPAGQQDEARSRMGQPIALPLDTPQASAASTKDPAKAPAPARLTLATWNLQYLDSRSGHGAVPRRDSDYAKLERLARALEADIVAVQEVADEAALARVFPRSDYAFHLARRGDAQRVGFAVRRGIAFDVMPDVEALAVSGGLRAGADIAVPLANGERLRILAVHLASGCFDVPLATRSRACEHLEKQLPIVEAWLDDRAREGSAAIVLGDFNRRFFKTPGGDAPWRALNDGEPADSDLRSPTETRRAGCWNGRHPVFIDHLVLNRPAARLLREGSFEEHVYPRSLTRDRAVLSDHCPLSIELVSE